MYRKVSSCTNMYQSTVLCHPRFVVLALWFEFRSLSVSALVHFNFNISVAALTAEERTGAIRQLESTRSAMLE